MFGDSVNGGEGVLLGKEEGVEVGVDEFRRHGDIVTLKDFVAERDP